MAVLHWWPAVFAGLVMALIQWLAFASMRNDKRMLRLSDADRRKVKFWWIGCSAGFVALAVAFGAWIA